MAEKLSPSGKLIVDHDGAVTTITLNRPRVHNALDQEISAELNAAVKDVAVDRDCRVLILRGAGDTFCAGDDIKGFLDFAPDDGPWNIRMYQETVQHHRQPRPGHDRRCRRRLHRRRPGTHLGLRLRHRHPPIALGHARDQLGHHPRVGRHRAAEQVRRSAQDQGMELLGYLFSGAVAERHDLVNRLCAPENLDDEIRALTEVLLDKDRHATTVTKYFVDKGADLDMWSSMFFEGNPSRFGPGENAMAGIQDFTQKSTRDERRKLIMDFWQD